MPAWCSSCRQVCQDLQPILCQRHFGRHSLRWNNELLQDYLQSQWFDNVHLWGKVFVGKRAFRTSAHAELAFRDKKHSQRKSKHELRADVYISKTAQQMQTSVEEYYLSAVDAAASDSKMRDEKEEGLLLVDGWGRSPLSSEDQQVAKDVAKIQKQVHNRNLTV